MGLEQAPQLNYVDYSTTMQGICASTQSASSPTSAPFAVWALTLLRSVIIPEDLSWDRLQQMEINPVTGIEPFAGKTGTIRQQSLFYPQLYGR